MSVFDLIGAVGLILKRFNSRDDVRQIDADPYTVSEKIDTLRTLIAGRGALKFSELFEAARSRTEVVVTFLAVLELTRMKQLVLRQVGGQVHGRVVAPLRRHHDGADLLDLRVVGRRHAVHVAGDLGGRGTCGCQCVR